MTRPAGTILVDAMSVAMYGRRLLPYQRADLVAAMQATDEHGHPAHRRLLLLLPRQTTKTTSIFLTALTRTYLLDQHHAVYAAQQGTVSTRRFALTGGWIDTVRSSALAARLGTVRSQGREAITNPARLSYYMALNPRPGAARSDSLDLVVLDECQEHTFERADQLLGDLGPTFATRPRRQLVLAGTATDGPTWWRQQVAAARAGTPGAGHLVELGTWPADADPTDPAVWQAHHPGLRAGLTTHEFLTEQLAELGPDAFAREYGNRFGDTAAADAPIPLALWDAATPAADPGVPAAVAVDVTLDRTQCAIVGVSTTGHARLLARCTPEQLPGTVNPLAGELPVCLLPGQAGTAAQLRAAGVHTQLVTVEQYRQACQLLHDDVAAGRVHHDQQPELRDAWTIAARAWHGDTWVLSARRSGGVIAPAVALVVAWWRAAAGDPTMV